MPKTEKQYYQDKAKKSVPHPWHILWGFLSHIFVHSSTISLRFNRLKDTFNLRWPDYVYKRRPNNSRKKRRNNPGPDSPIIEDGSSRRESEGVDNHYGEESGGDDADGSPSVVVSPSPVLFAFFGFTTLTSSLSNIVRPPCPSPVYRVACIHLPMPPATPPTRTLTTLIPTILQAKLRLSNSRPLQLTGYLPFGVPMNLPDRNMTARIDRPRELLQTIHLSMKKVSNGLQVLVPAMVSRIHLAGKTFCRQTHRVPVPYHPPVVFQGPPQPISLRSSLPPRLPIVPTVLAIGMQVLPV